VATQTQRPLAGDDIIRVLTEMLLLQAKTLQAKTQQQPLPRQEEEERPRSVTLTPCGHTRVPLRKRGGGCAAGTVKGACVISNHDLWLTFVYYYALSRITSTDVPSVAPTRPQCPICRERIQRTHEA
jgi:hypothetical protein